MVIGIVIKKIIINAWVVINILKDESFKNFLVCISSIRIISLIAKPIEPDHIPKDKYIIPIFLWLVLKNKLIKILKLFNVEN